MQGKYELRLMIANAVNTLRISDAFYFQVTEPEVRGVVLGSGEGAPGEDISVRMDVPRSGGEKRINISYDPAVVEATGVFGPCNAPSYIDSELGRISVVMPVNCSSTNITFRALSLGDKANATVTMLQVTDAIGFKQERITNGSIAVVPNGNAENETGRTDTDIGTIKKSGAPAFAVALAALALTAFAWRRRRS
jgi:hypothetical protein